MLQINAELIFRDIPHLLLHIILHPFAQPKPLAQLTRPKDHVRAQHHEFEQQMPPTIQESLGEGKISGIDKAATRPRAGHFDAVYGTAEELVVSLHDSHVASDEQQLSREVVFFGKDVADALAHTLLYLIVSLGCRLAFQLSRNAVFRRAVTTLVGFHEGSAGKEIGCFHSPCTGDGGERGIVKCHDCFPELAVLVTEFRRHLDVESVVDEDELWLSIGFPANENIAGMRIAVHDAPEEHLRGK